MSGWLTPVLQALDSAAAPLDAFVRDDDAGWDDSRLFALVDTAEQAGACLDLAAIPQAMSAPLAAALIERLDALPGRLGLHQHGFAHTNHEPAGRKCEFGAARGAAAQHHDLVAGRRRLQEHFGHHLQPIFTPPWNRCAPHTPLLLATLGFAALSRDRGAAAQAALPDLPVDVDWSRQLREGGREAAAAALAAALQARMADGAPLGLMLHHATMDAAAFADLGELLHGLSRHGALRWHPMAALLPAAVTSEDPTR